MKAFSITISNLKILSSMKKKALLNVRAQSRKVSILVMSIIALCSGCRKSDVDRKQLLDFKQVNLVANKSDYHPVTVDPLLLNGFGMAWSPNGTAWVNSVGGHVSALYTAEGAIARKPVNIPSPTDIIGGFPTGIVFSGGKGFNLSNGPSLFLFTGFDGVLSGWNGASGDNAQRLRNPAGASYTGLAIATSGNKNFIYGANFGASKIDVWDTAFSRVTTMSFVDPSLPAGYSPYNIQAVGEFLFVIYGKLGANGLGVAGPGNGYVSVFNTDGSFVKRFASEGSLNLPWGVTAAPASFLESQDMSEEGKYGSEKTVDDNKNEKNDKSGPVILVGNFGDGRINVYTPDGKFLGQLQSRNHPIEIDGLWALSFAPSTANVDPSRLYFTAGPKQESDGLFGYLIKE
ncbi:MAG TPA: TIGR03118 family protein [Flavitalea sp.]|nr:TIGR03118 family protein [Flavitalea sp.]